MGGNKKFILSNFILRPYFVQLIIHQSLYGWNGWLIICQFCFLWSPDLIFASAAFFSASEVFFCRLVISECLLSLLLFSFFFYFRIRLLNHLQPSAIILKFLCQEHLQEFQAHHGCPFQCYLQPFQLNCLRETWTCFTLIMMTLRSKQFTDKLCYLLLS